MAGTWEYQGRTYHEADGFDLETTSSPDGLEIKARQADGRYVKQPVKIRGCLYHVDLVAHSIDQAVELGWLVLDESSTAPEPFEFSENADGTPLTLDELIGQALGAASMCWDERPSGDFISERASQIADALVDRINQWVEQ